MKLRTSFVVWLVVVGLCILIAGAGCGEVTVQAAAQDAIDDARDDATDGGADHNSDDGRDVERPHDVLDSTPAPTCAAYTSPPYCASCRDARGVCYCGKLPCCDQGCQS